MDTKKNQPTIYRITVEGLIDPQWSQWYAGLTIRLESELPPISSLTGPTRDQAALRGILNKLWDLNLSLVAVERLTDYLAPADS